jgi:glycerate-2-kinase
MRDGKPSMRKVMKGPRRSRIFQHEGSTLAGWSRLLSGNVNDEGLRGLRRDALACLSKALHAVDPEHLVKETLRIRRRTLEVQGRRFRLGGRTIYLLAVGKGAVPMARAARRSLSVASGILVTDQKPLGSGSDRIRWFRGSHPLPDRESLAGGDAALRLVDGLEPNDILLVLLSGGASAMFEVSPLSLEDLRSAHTVLLRSALSIRDINEVRKGLSEVKGGRLAARAAARGATVLGLILSDIIGNPIADIGSGPTALDSSRGSRAVEVLRAAGLWREMPRSARVLLEGRRVEGKPDRSWTQRVHNVIVGDVARACVAAVGEARRRGYETRLLSSSVEGEAREVGPWFVSRSLRSARGSLAVGAVAGGETTVRIVGTGHGGPNQELVLSVVEAIEGNQMVVVACGTDGIDGNTDAAGAIADGETMGRARALKLDPKDYLRANNACDFFHALDDLVVTGPTGTNVADLMICLARRPIRGGRGKLNRSVRTPGTSGTRRTPHRGRRVRRSPAPH